MPRLARVTAVLALGAFLALGGAGVATAAPTAHADVDDFEFESFHSDYVLDRTADGHAQLRVTETIVAVFPQRDQNRGFYRDIPEYRHGVQLHTVVESVVDEFGQPVPYETEYYQDFYSVALGDDSFVHGRQTYVITYRQVDVVEAFGDTGFDEFYWDVNGTGWAQPFDRVSMRLLVAPSIATALTGNTECYVFGDCDEPVSTTPQPDGSVVFAAASNGLVPNESLTFAIEFEPGTFEPGPQVIPPPSTGGDGPEDCCAPGPGWWDTTAPFILGPAGVILSFVAGATQVANRSRRTGPSDIIVPQYTPPKDLNVMVAAYVAGYPEKAFAAQLVDLAVRGNLRLLDNAPDAKASFEVELLHEEGLDDLERKVVAAVFGAAAQSGARVPVTPGNTTIGRRLTDVFRAVDAQLKKTGLQGPTRPTVLWSILFFLSIAVAIGAGVNALRGLAAGYPELSLLAAGVAIFTAVQTYGKRSTVATLSTHGRGVNDHLLGLRDYMELAEEDRIRMLQSPEGAERVTVDTTDPRQMVKLYERLLPYAVIYGIEDRWAEELTITAVAAQVPVSWYAGSTDLTAWRLNSTIKNLRRMQYTPPQPAVPQPVRTKSGGGDDSFWGGWGSGSSSSGWRGSSGSSFSSGSRGGGFSGGGGGGGGGRGR